MLVVMRFSFLRTEDWGIGPQKFCWSSQAACQLATVCASLHARSSINAVAKMYEKEEGANMFFSFDPVWPPYQAPPICPKWSKWLSGVKTLSRRLILSWWPPDMEKAEDVADKTANLTKMCKYQNAAKKWLCYRFMINVFQFVLIFLLSQHL